MKHPDQAVNIPEEQMRDGMDMYQRAKLLRMAEAGATPEAVSQALLVRLKHVKAEWPKPAKKATKE